MANTYITSTSRFKPYTFAEMLQPVQIYTEASNAVETELSNLDILANDVVGKLNPNDPEDAKTLETYKSFKNKMDNALESFYKDGLTPESKKALASLKSQYSKDINPINTAYERRVKDLDLIRQMKLSNPYIVIEGIGQSTSAYMNGNTPEPVVVDLNKASEAAKNASTGLSKQFIEQIGLQGAEGYIGRYLMHGMKKGIDSTMVADFTAYVDAIKNGKNKELQTPQGLALSKMFEQIRTANNYDNLSENAQKRLDASIVQGLVSGAAADVDIKYMEDNYWNIELAKAKLKALRDSGNGGGTDLDLRTDSTLYKGANFDVSQIADLMGEQFKNPIEYNGTKIYDPIQAYNIIHKDDARIAELEKYLNTKYVGKISMASSASSPSTPAEYNSDGSIKQYVYVNGKYNEDLTNIYSEITVLNNQKKQRSKDLDGVALTDKDVARIREYSKSSSTGMLTPDEVHNFAEMVASDFTAYSGAEKTATIFSQTNSKDGLEDMVKTISNNVMQEWQKGHSLKITTSEGKEIKDKEFEKLIDSETGALDVSKISSIELDFIAAERGAVKLVTTDGKVYYVDADYIGDQSKAYVKILQNKYNNLNTDDDIPNTKKSPEYSPTSGENKLMRLNMYLKNASDSIQPQYTHNRQTNQSLTE